MSMLSCAYTSVDVRKVSDDVGRRVVCGRQRGASGLASLVFAVEPLIDWQA